MDLILKYFPDLTEKQIEQFNKVGDLYKHWNEQINVVSRKDIEEIYTNHILHSLAIAKVMKFEDGSDVLDVGTGGGLPGIPLAILFPNVNFHLVDSIGKKIKVVQGVADGLGLTNVKAEQKRAEELHNHYDFVISRAVTAMPRFAEWIRGKFKKDSLNPLPNGLLYLKGGDLSEELKDFPNAELHNISDFFEEDFFETKKVVYLHKKDI
ncbi:16S rRNA (guanine(527)-N(7))-methyltransferase RsmG [Faecalibacter bovis]|uniref:Ribosomal RNA small subunit methyltransferase G n=1 Tax=Faecalibacter bovis TaxID=2898187 RepID=A0ABX7XEH4_9FLAO|nr:16S rRNA (guanine(527)-N(7))-methyltransferase RsmG [Faecalibacter bovis]MBS7333605.1 16S rRNA (guanine(527)-N(7))-methyltransferase RsmG [Weeksellaceae bacterium]QTV06290.1 16S rRNA (guanine(527)-N(7))-methyltransferase RsmG [Faecalibacter bovis]